MEKSMRSEATLTVRMKHEDDYGMNADNSPLESRALSQLQCARNCVTDEDNTNN